MRGTIKNMYSTSVFMWEFQSASRAIPEQFLCIFSSNLVSATYTFRENPFKISKLTSVKTIAKPVRYLKIYINSKLRQTCKEFVYVYTFEYSYMSYHN